MKLKKNDFFRTPDNHEEIVEFIEENFPKTSKSQAMMVAMMTWNLACEMQNNEEPESN